MSAPTRRATLGGVHGIDRLLATHDVAWTLADLAGRDRPGSEDVAVALAMRRGEQLDTSATEAG